MFLPNQPFGQKYARKERLLFYITICIAVVFSLTPAVASSQALGDQFRQALNSADQSVQRLVNNNSALAKGIDRGLKSLADNATAFVHPEPTDEEIALGRAVTRMMLDPRDEVFEESLADIEEIILGSAGAKNISAKYNTQGIFDMSNHGVGITFTYDKHGYATNIPEEFMLQVWNIFNGYVDVPVSIHDRISASRLLRKLMKPKAILYLQACGRTNEQGEFVIDRIGRDCLMDVYDGMLSGASSYSVTAFRRDGTVTKYPSVQEIVKEEKATMKRYVR